MEEKLRQSWPERQPGPAEQRKLSVALRQVEWADTYLNAIVNLDLEDHESRVAVHELRRQLTALELHLRKLAAS
jgi:hypothetical protein